MNQHMGLRPSQQFTYMSTVLGQAEHMHAHLLEYRVLQTCTKYFDRAPACESYSYRAAQAWLRRSHSSIRFKGAGNSSL